MPDSHDHRLIEQVEELLIKHRESMSVMSSAFIQDNQTKFKTISDKIDNIEMLLAKLNERTENTPLVNKAVFASIGFLVVGFFGVVGEIIIRQLHKFIN